MVYPNQESQGAMMNVSAMPLTLNSPNRSQAEELIAYLASDIAQKIYAEQTLNGR